MSPSLKRTVLITGGTSGLGYHCAATIARSHPEYHVVIASRSDNNDAASSINQTLGQKNVSFLRLDLSSLAEVRAFAYEWKQNKYPPIEALLLNAGVQYPYEISYTKDGFESTFGISHVGHALLFFLLMPHLSNTARIVLTSSSGHDPAQKTILPDAEYTRAEQLAHPSPISAAQNSGLQRYSTAKLANVLWMYALHRRIVASKRSWTVAAFDPGTMPGTGLAREANALVRFIFGRIFPRIIPFLRLVLRTKNVHAPKESAGNLAWVSVNPAVLSRSGVYYEEQREINSSDDSYDEDKQEDLWEWTVNTIATSQEERERFSLRNLK